jgi:hypothetical protein
VCVRGRARIRADACEHFTPAPSVALIGAQAFNSASAFNANIGAWNTASVTDLSMVCAASGPARTAADCARPVADACAAGVCGGAADVCVCVCVGVSMAARCMRANYENLSIFLLRGVIAAKRCQYLSTYVRTARAHTPPLHTRARSRARAAARACLWASSGVCASLATHEYKGLYMVTSINTAPVLRMRGGVCRCLTHAYTRIYMCICTHMYASVFASVRALVCVRRRARIRANACEHFPPPPSVAVSGSQAFDSASAFKANISAWNTARVATLVSVSAAFGPARTAADCARSVVDACAAVARGGAADACARARAGARAHVAMCIRVYLTRARACSYVYKGVSGWIAHMCSSAIERSLHPRLSMSNAHTHRPFPRCMYTCIRMHASIVRARACVRGCVAVSLRACV